MTSISGRKGVHEYVDGCDELYYTPWRIEEKFPLKRINVC